MTRKLSALGISLALGAAALIIGCSDSGSTSPDASGSGTLVTRLTDAPFPTDLVKNVDIFVVRVDAKAVDADSADADHGFSDDSSSTSGWKTVATPNAAFNLLTLQNGITATLGQTELPAGTYKSFRFIIDPSKSSVTLKTGLVLSGGSSPNVSFPSASRSGIKVELTQPLVITAGQTTDLVIDFDVEKSFVMRGNAIDKNGLLFKPVVKATITDLALTNATVRLGNATDVPLNLLQNAAVLTGGSAIAFGQSSSCSSVPVATPLLTITQTGSTTPLTGFTPTLTAGNKFSVIAYPGTGTTVNFATLGNVFTPTAGQSGLRVFNGTTSATGYDVFVTTSGAPLATATVANVLAGASSAFVSIPAGTSQVRVTATGTTTPLVVDVPAQAFVADKNATIVIAPPAAGSTAPRVFVVAGC